MAIAPIAGAPTGAAAQILTPAALEFLELL
jgi:hypothetical protein